MKKALRLFAAATAAVMMTTGCSKSAGKDSGKTSSGENVGNEVGVYGAVVSVADIKEAYGVDDSGEIMPLYNVDPGEEFEFNFKFDAYESGIDLYDFVSVHTDSECAESSEVYYTADLDVADGASKLTVSPMTPVLATESQMDEYLYEDAQNWGNAPIYYIALHYDLEADTPVKLDSPTVIPFTVKKEAAAPTIRGEVSADGRFSLQWDPVEGAEKYMVYKLLDGDLETGADNHAIDGARSGYDCGSNTADEDQLYLIWDGETEECVYDGFAGPKNHSTAEITDMATGKPKNSGQNYSVFGEYFVTAVVGGKESGLSNPVSTAELSLPFTFAEGSEIEGRYETPADFPAEVEILNIDGTTAVRSVSYERTHVDFYEYSWDEYEYTVEGTYIFGTVNFDEDEGEPPQPTGASADTGNAAPDDNVDKTPGQDVQTIIPPNGDDDAGNGDADDGGNGSLIDEQADNTQDHIENGNLSQVENAPEGVYINAQSAEEEWLALNLVRGNTEISVEAFPSLQDPYTLSDVFYKVYYQNPYIMGITSFDYDYNKLTMNVRYVYDAETIAGKQAEVAQKADEVLGSIITDGMDARQKIKAIYDHLENNSVYDTAALEEAEKNGYKKGEGFTREDAFNSYGVLVEGKGVCMSYAYVFRLLCDMSGVECAVVTGYLDGNLPHAWNMVKLDGEWYEIDCTNNAVNSGVPYYLYQADSGLAEASGYTKDKLFAIDDEIGSFSGEDGSLEYYRENGLCPENMDEYVKLITENVTQSTGVFAVRWQGTVDNEELSKAIVLAYSEIGLEDKLETLRYAADGGFIIIINE